MSLTSMSECRSLGIAAQTHAVRSDDDDEGSLGRPPPAAMGVTPSSSQDPAEW